MRTKTGIDLYRGGALISQRQTAATVATKIVWAIRNGGDGTRVIAIERLALKLFHDGAAPGSAMFYEVIKGTASPAFTDGATITPLHTVTSEAASLASQIRTLDTGLTLAGVSWGSPLAYAFAARIAFSTTGYSMPFEFPFARLKEIELVQNEVLAIRLVNTAVIGDNIQGHCEFSEKQAAL